MNDRTAKCGLLEWAGIAAVLLVFAALSTVGIGWGLPGREIDKYLFGKGEPWSGEKIHRLTGAAGKFSPDRGADVDVDPLDKSSGEPILLTGTDEDVAKIYLRYRLFTYQPDEMITMMALAGMRPRSLDLDPRLYQYGGLFIYPVGGLIGVCSAIGLIDVRSDVVYYLDNPDEFGKFYIVARAYAAVWGLVGVVVVFAIARRLGGLRAGLLAALLFTLLPVVICMAHEGKPHMPGSVLMLLAVLFAMRCCDLRGAGFSSRGGSHRDAASAPAAPPHKVNLAARDWWLMCVCCGAAFGMVLSSLPIFVLIPVVAWRAVGSRLHGGSPGCDVPRGAASPRKLRLTTRERLVFILKRTVLGTGVGVLTYLITNPYIMINAMANREVLQSNFGNSLAMYEIARIGEGFARVLELTIEGATLPVLVLGAMALIIAVLRKNAAIIPLAVPALIFFLQFVLIGAGKPAEYGRFGIFTNTALAIGTACLFTRRWRGWRDVVITVAALPVVVWTASAGSQYLWNFHIDTTEHGSRIRYARCFHPRPGGLGVLAEPAPYCCPPLDFSRVAVSLRASVEEFERSMPPGSQALIWTSDDPSNPRVHALLSAREIHPLKPRFWWIPTNPHTPISWANKPIQIGWVGSESHRHNPLLGRLEGADAMPDPSD